MNGYGAVPEYDELESMETREKQERSFTVTNTGAGGRKFDSGKLQYGLVPPNALKETVKVLTLGAEKYDRNNWKKVPDAQARYYDALQRHLWDWFAGEQLDPETGINHLAHAMCNIMFLLERDLYTEEEWEEVVKSVYK